MGARGASGLAVLAILLAVVAAPARAGVASFSYTGAEQAFTVPAGVYSLKIVTVGAMGGPGLYSSGGHGAVMAATVAATPGATLYVEVGGAGSSGSICCGASFNGGGPGGIDSVAGYDGGGGGGASDVRRVPSGAAGSLESRLVVAGGGGGGGGGVPGSDGGEGGAAGWECEGCGEGGGQGTATAGGPGGSDDGGGVATAGDAGGLGAGGAGGEGGPGGGGGGGGGYYGGGGGGGATSTSDSAGGGGGGGSSFAVGGGTATVDTSGVAEVRVSYTFGRPAIAVAPSPVQFGAQVLSSVGERTVTVTNTGTAPLQVLGATIAGVDPADFQPGTGCAAPVAIGASCQLAVRFSPRAVGYRRAELQIASNARSFPTRVSLYGRGASAPAPVLSALDISPSAFKAAKRGTSMAAGGNATVSYRADIAGAATFRALRVKSGVRRGKQCVKAPRVRRKGARPCTRLVPVGAAFTHQGQAGDNSFRFTGRVDDLGVMVKLAPGRYRLRATGSTAAASVSAGFRIARS